MSERVNESATTHHAVARDTEPAPAVVAHEALSPRASGGAPDLRDLEIDISTARALINSGNVSAGLSHLTLALDRIAALSSSVSPKEVCICAAIQLADGRIVRGHRHDDCIQTIIKWRKAGQNPSLVSQAVQGFLTTRERFVDREEGYRLQLAAGRIPNTRRGAHILTSEDLY